MSITMLTIVVSLSITALTVGLHTVVRRRINVERMRAHHDVAAAIYAMLGVLHGLIFGYLVVTGQDRLDRAGAAVTREAALLMDLQHRSYAMRADDGQKLRDAVARYAHHVIDVGWPSMAADAPHDVRPRPLRDLWNVIVHADTASDVSRTVRTSSLQVLDDLSEVREHRAHLADERLGPVMMFVLYLGAWSLIAGLFAFVHQSAVVQLSMTAMVTLTVSLIVALILAFDAPVASGMLTPDAMKEVLRHSSPSP